MVTAVEIIRALTINCRNLLNCDVNDRDISEGFDRPSFFIEVNSFTNGDIGESLRGDTLNISIYYFHEKRVTGYLVLLEAREKLRELLAQPIQITDGFSITADEIEEDINKADMTYITSFDVTINQFREEAEAPYMEKLAYNGQLQHDDAEETTIEEDD